MSVLGNGFKGNLWTGLGIGLGATILAPAVVPLVGAVVRPLAKAAIKGGLIVYEMGRETVAEVREMTEDLAAEAQAELSAGREGEEGEEEAPRPKKRHKGKAEG